MYYCNDALIRKRVNLEIRDRDKAGRPCRAGICAVGSPAFGGRWHELADFMPEPCCEPARLALPGPFLHPEPEILLK